MTLTPRDPDDAAAAALRRLEARPSLAFARIRFDARRKFWLITDQLRPVARLVRSDFTLAGPEKGGGGGP